jgi:hypothetical protein
LEEEEVPFNQVQHDTKLLVQRLGLDEETATRYAHLVRAHGRPPGYVAELIDHALSDPEVRDPVKVVCKNITTNARRGQPNGAAEEPRPNRRRRVRQRGPSFPFARSDTRPATAPAMAAGQPDAAVDPEPEDYSPIWRAAQTALHLACRPDEYESAVRYLQLLEIDRDRGWALLGAPNAHAQHEVQTRLMPLIEMALHRACGTRLKLLVVIRSPKGTPRLADLLVSQDKSADESAKSQTSPSSPPSRADKAAAAGESPVA